MKTHTPWLFFLSLVVVALTFMACDSDGNGGEEGGGPPENITRVVITVETGSGANLATYTAADRGDGLGFQAETMNLMGGVTYTGTIEVFDDTIASAPDRNITDEIREERDAHRFFFTYAAVEGAAGRVMAVPTDLDNNNLPVGLEFQLTVSQGGVAAGSLTVILSHFGAQPKSASPGGQTDVEVSFPIIVR